MVLRTPKSSNIGLTTLMQRSAWRSCAGLPGHWEELKNERAGQFSVRLHGGLRLIVKPQTQPPPAKPDGGLDWAAIDSLYIVEMVDYHD